MVLLSVFLFVPYSSFLPSLVIIFQCLISGPVLDLDLVVCSVTTFQYFSLLGLQIC
jgi:hypothetical protein